MGLELLPSAEVVYVSYLRGSSAEVEEVLRLCDVVVGKGPDSIGGLAITCFAHGAGLAKRFLNSATWSQFGVPVREGPLRLF